MTKESLVSFFSEEDKKKLLNFRSASELRPKPKAPAVSAAVVSLVDVKPEQCEFAIIVPFLGCTTGRLCWDKTFCPTTVFADVKVFPGCKCRKDRLKELQKKEST